MTLKEILEEYPKLTVEGLQRFQRKYDEMFVDDEFQGFDKVRHTYAHMGNLFGRLSKYVQMVEDGHKDFSPEDVKTKVIPDLIVYSCWLAEQFEVEVDIAYLSRMVDNIKRLHPNKIPQDELNELEKYIEARFNLD